MNPIDFLIIGAPRCGTTSLYNYLKEHPQIFMPKQKELYFLCAERTPEVVPKHIKRVATFDEYKRHFAEASPSQIKGEATPRYLSMYEETIENAKKYFPNWQDIKIIISLRDPVERAFSHYTQDRRAGIEHRPFVTAFKRNLKLMRDQDKRERYRYPGMYYEQVKAYLDNFHNVKIILYDDLVQDRQKVCSEVFSFLGVDPAFVPQNLDKIYNEGKKIYRSTRWARLTYQGYYKRFISVGTFRKYRDFINKYLNFKKVALSTRDKELVLPYFLDDIKKLEALLHRDLSSWYRL
jgi:hypothetical protein